MSLDSCLFKHLKIVNGCLKVCLTDTVNSKSYCILTGIKHSVLACAVVLKFKEYIAVIKCVNVLCLSCVKLFHIYSSFY